MSVSKHPGERDEELSKYDAPNEAELEAKMHAEIGILREHLRTVEISEIVRLKQRIEELEAWQRTALIILTALQHDGDSKKISVETDFDTAALMSYARDLIAEVTDSG